MRAPRLTLLALLAILAGPTCADAARLPAPAPLPDGVRAGERITTVIPALPPGTREFELLLLPDGGPAIVVSPELSAAVASVTWRMPRTFAGRARLALRAGSEHDERTSAASREFALAPLAPQDLVVLVSGRAPSCAWVGCFSAPGLAWSAPSAPDEWTNGVATSLVAPPPPPPAIPQPERAGVVLAAAADAPESRSSQKTFPRSPSWTPLRN